MKQRPCFVINSPFFGHHPSNLRPRTRLLPRRVSAHEKNRIKKQNQIPLGHTTTHRHTHSSSSACLALCGSAAPRVVMSPRAARWCVCGMWIAPRVRDQTTIRRTPREHTTTHTSCGCQYRRNSRHVAAAPENRLPPPPHTARAAAGERAKLPGSPGASAEVPTATTRRQRPVPPMPP